jgi:hypothetical protein
MIRSIVVQIVVAPVLLGSAGQASWSGQLGCNSPAAVETICRLSVGQVSLNRRHQPGVCRRQLACVSSISFHAVPNADEAQKNACIAAFAPGLSSDVLSSVQP